MADLTKQPVFSSTNPFIPPPPPQAQNAALGFSLWAQDPLNAMKVQPSMTDPDQPLHPNKNASANPPTGSAPQPVAPLTAPQAPGMSPAPAVQQSTATPRLPTQQEDMSANPNSYVHPYVKGTKTNILNMIVAGLQGAAGGMHGDPGAGIKYAMDVKAHDEGVGGQNQQVYNNKFVAPVQNALKTQQLQS